MPGADDAVELAKLATEDVTIKEEKSVEGLVLGSCGNVVVDGQIGEEAANLRGPEIVGGSATDKSLEFSNPKTTGAEGFAGAVAEPDRGLQLSVLGALGWRHASLLEAALKSGPGVCGNLMHRNVNRQVRPAALVGWILGGIPVGGKGKGRSLLG